MTDRQDLNISWLFESEALMIAPPDKPFLGTSGLLLPYFINTHYLCGGKNTAAEVLALIDQQQDSHSSFAGMLIEKLRQVYDSHHIYSGTIDAFTALAKEELDLTEIDYISGGQRRDWFFAPLAAQKLEKPCLYIYNDQKIFAEDGTPVDDLAEASVLNIADLLTVGSSYTKKWVPALQQVNASLDWSLNGVDRNQGGQENLTQAGVKKCFSLFSINRKFFEAAFDNGSINAEQAELLFQYLDDPYQTMRNFIVNNRQFIENSKNAADEKTRTRIQLMLDEDLYKLKD